MYSNKSIQRVKLIKKKIEFINEIIKQKGSLSLALEDEINSRASILMHLISIAEQFDRLIKNGEVEVLSNFDKQDIKGSYDLRNFIAHDYEGVDIFIVESIIQNRLPIILKATNKILKDID